MNHDMQGTHICDLNHGSMDSEMKISFVSFSHVFFRFMICLTLFSRSSNCFQAITQNQLYGAFDEAAARIG